MQRVTAARIQGCESKDAKEINLKCANCLYCDPSAAKKHTTYMYVRWPEWVKVCAGHWIRLMKVLPLVFRLFLWMFGFGSAACCGIVVGPQDDAVAPAAKIFLQSASSCSVAAVNEKHISMMHDAPQKQHRPGGARSSRPTIKNQPNKQFEPGSEEDGDEASGHKQLSGTRCEMWQFYWSVRKLYIRSEREWILLFKCWTLTTILFFSLFSVVFGYSYVLHQK